MLWRLFKKLPFYELTVIILFIAIYSFFRSLGITCIIYELTGRRCPTCGMGRALIALLCGRVQLYFSYNAMALPVALAFVSELFGKRFGSHAVFVHIFSVSVLAINLLYRLFS